MSDKERLELLIKNLYDLNYEFLKDKDILLLDFIYAMPYVMRDIIANTINNKYKESGFINNYWTRAFLNMLARKTQEIKIIEMIDMID